MPLESTDLQSAFYNLKWYLLLWASEVVAIKV